jgi:hypothetical protein
MRDANNDSEHRLPRHERRSLSNFFSNKHGGTWILAYFKFD